MHTSFLTHAGARYFWVAVLLGLASSGAYILHEPTEPPNGGTALGYALGTIGALMILWLAYLGRRKRNYAKGWGTVRGWVSAHVYLGTALIVVATLHTGFQFDWNIHTLAFVLMVAVILSGLFGVFAYRTYPSARNNLKRTKTLDEVFLQVEDLDAQLIRMVNSTDADIRNVVLSSIERTVVGGGFFAQIMALDHSVVDIEGNVVKNAKQSSAMDFLLSRLRDQQGEALDHLGDVIRAFNSRKGLLDVIRQDIRMHAIIQIWLFVHVPLTFALIAALLAHIFAVFIYW